MEWSCIILVSICVIIPTVSSYSGAGLGSDDGHVSSSSADPVTETVIHEITITDFYDLDSPSYEWTTQPATVPCENEADCSVTEAPQPTQILSIDISDDPTDPTDDRNSSDTHQTTINTKYISSKDVIKSYSFDNAHTFFYNALQTITDQVDILVHRLPTSVIAGESEAKVNLRLEKIENSLGNILTSLRSLTPTHPPEMTVRDKSDLVATETWTYIDSKFTELKSNLLNTNEKIKVDLEEKLKEVLNKHNRIDLNAKVYEVDEENIMSLGLRPETINKLTKLVSRKAEVSSKALLPKIVSIASHHSATTRQYIPNEPQNSRVVNFQNFKERKADGKKRSIGDPLVLYRRQPPEPTISVTTNDGRTKTYFASGIPMHCADIYLSGLTKSGVYLISPLGQDQWKVYCDMETDGGGWTVLQRRTFGNVNFTRGWADYKRGFGVVTGDFWLGLEKMHILTGGLGHQQAMSLRIDLKDWSNVAQFAHYNLFKISGEHQRYRLDVKDYHGTAGNALQYTPSGFYNHNHQSFSTIDRDHDSYRIGNCGKYYGSGWWFRSCFAANLNGKYYRGTYRGIRDGIYWGTWYRLNDATTNSRHSFKYVDMKVRPTDFERRKSLPYDQWQL